MNVIKAIQIIYPEIQGGFSYWETKLDGTDWDNPIEGLVWDNKEYPQPSWEDIDVALKQVDLEVEKEKKIEEINKFRDQQFFEKLEAEDPIYIQAKLKREELDALTTIKKVKCYKIDKIIDPITKKTIKGEIDDSQQL